MLNTTDNYYKIVLTYVSRFQWSLAGVFHIFGKLMNYYKCLGGVDPEATQITPKAPVSSLISLTPPVKWQGSGQMAWNIRGTAANRRCIFINHPSQPPNSVKSLPTVQFKLKLYVDFLCFRAKRFLEYIFIYSLIL